LNLETAWKEFAETRDLQLRNKLVLFYAPLVKYVAGQIYSRLPPRSVEISDLISAGSIGLIEAVENFKPEKGYKFETYAFQRIKGSIIDFLRKLDWLPRNLRIKTKKLEEAYFKLEEKLNRPPSDEELKEYLGYPDKDFQAALSAVGHSHIIALEDLKAQISEGESSASIYEALEDKSQPDPLEVVVKREQISLLARAIKQLSPREREVIIYYYFRNFNLKEIGKIMGISESRVSQIHGRALLSLKYRLKSLV